MTKQGTRMFGAVVAAAVATAVGSVAAARPADGQDRTVTIEQATPGIRVWPDRSMDRQVFVGPGTPADRQVIRLDGRGSQIGVMVSDLDAGPQAGVRIDGVDDDSPAQKAGMQDGDVVVEFDGERVRSARQLTRLVQETPSGRAVKVTVLRGSARQILDITPASSQTTWNMPVDEPGRRGELGRSLRGLPDLPHLAEPMFNFRWPERAERFDGVPVPTGRGRLGVQIEPLSDQLAGYFGVKGGGVLVSSVTKDSPAEKAGLKAGDVITSVNGTAVRDADDLIAGLGATADGGEVRLGLVRDKKVTTATATIERPRATPSTRSSRPA